MTPSVPRLPALLFDLDGTLVDSVELILSSGRHAFIDFAGRPPTDDEWRAGIGRPLRAMFRDHTADETEVERLVARYREFQTIHHDALVTAYEGVVETILALTRAGHAMALVTSKGEVMAVRALELVGLAEAFHVIVGMESCERHKPHPEPVQRALALLGAAPEQALFVGDSSHDVECGRAAGVYTVGVTWGALRREEMERCGADAVIHHMTELPGVIRGCRGAS
jgi:pyrophosphatase PpaX